MPLKRLENRTKKSIVRGIYPGRGAAYSDSYSSRLSSITWVFDSASSMSGAKSTSASLWRISSSLGCVTGWRGTNTVQQSSYGSMDVS